MGSDEKNITTFRQKNITNDVMLSVVEYVRNNGKLPQTWSHPMERDRVIRPLKVANILIRRGYGVWGIDEEAWQKEHHNLPTKEHHKQARVLPLSVRGHGFQFYLSVPSRIAWNLRLTIIKNMGISYDYMKGESYRLRIYGHKVWFCEEGIIVYFPEGKDYYGDSAKATQQQAIFEFRRVIRRISTLSGLDFSYYGKLRFSLDKQHYADIEHELARQYNDDKDKLKVVGDDGKVWLLIDFSDHVDELECVHSQRAEKDHDKVIAPYFNDIRSNMSPLPSEVYKMIQGIIEAQKLATNNQVMYAENMVSHVRAVQELARGVKDLRHEVKGMFKARMAQQQRRLTEY